MQTRFHRLTLRVLTAGLLLAALFMVQGCDTESDDIPTGPAVTVEHMIETGWAQLNSGEVNEALFTFQEAANAEASNLEAYLGLGYSFAKAQEPISAKRNLNNVISLGGVMVESGEITEAQRDTLFAESHAGQASVAMSTQDYETAVAQAQLAEQYWAGFNTKKHRWMPEFDNQKVLVIETQAWYGMEEYGEVLLLLDQLDGGGFINELLNSGVLMMVENEAVTVTMLQETQHDGVAQLDIANENLVYPIVVSQGGIEYEVVGYDITGDAVRFQGNPIPSPGDEYLVSYYYAVDFGEFLIQLQDKLNEFE